MKIMYELHVSKELFLPSIVYATIDAYNSLTKIECIEEPVGWILRFSDCQYDPQTTVRKFNNYLINLASITL